MPRFTRQFRKKIGVVIVLVFLLIFALAPIYWMIITSVKTDVELYRGKYWFIPVKPTFTAYSEVFGQTKFITYYKNSLIVTGLTIAIALVISIFAAYSLTRLRWRGQRFIRLTVLFTYALPVVILVVPFFVVLSLLRLTDTLIGLVIAYLASITPFCTWFLMGYLQGMPTDIEDAAEIDGCGRFALIARIVIPLLLPGIATVTIYAFVQSWSLYLYPAILIRGAENQLLPVGISQFVQGDVYPWQKIMGAGLLVSVLPAVFFMFIQKYVVKGLTSGAIKG